MSELPSFKPVEFEVGGRFYKFEDRPDLLVRLDQSLSEHDASKRELIFEQFTNALFILDQQGISYPGISLTPHPYIEGETLIWAEMVSGEPLHIHNLDKIPPEVTRQAMYGYLQYYFESLDRQEPILGDLCLNQLMYGRRRCDNEDKLYFVDLDPIIAPVNITGTNTFGKTKPGEKAVFALRNDLRNMRDTYGEGFQELEFWINELDRLQPLSKPASL